MKIVTASKGRRGAGVDTVDCDVLVSSPAGMLTLVGEGLTGLYRCCHLVVEDGVKALEIQEEAGEKLRLDWRRRRVLQQNSQIRWWSWEKSGTRPCSFHREYFIENWKPLIVLGSLLEGAVYCQLLMLASFHTDNHWPFSRTASTRRLSSAAHIGGLCTPPTLPGKGRDYGHGTARGR